MDPVVPSSSTAPIEPAAGRADEMLLRYLSERDAHCPLCGYNLRNLTSARCPECGKEIELTVGLREPYLRAWIVATVCMVACAGVGLTFSLVILLEGLDTYSFMPLVGQLAIVLHIAAIPAVGLLIALRRRLLKWRPGSQRILAGGAVGYAMLAFALLILVILFD